MQNIGKIVQIIGAVVDIRFSKDCLPNLLNAIEVDKDVYKRQAYVFCRSGIGV